MEELWGLLPHLERLEVGANGLDLGRIVAPRLQHLCWHSQVLPEDTLDRLVQATLPSLRQLEIDFGDEFDSELVRDDLVVLLEGHALPALQHLALRDVGFTDDLLAALARSDLLPRLQQLDLSGGEFTSEGAHRLLAAADKFRHLQRLDLPGHDLEKGLGARLRSALPGLVLGRERNKK
jgi:hypothetical protein